MKNSFKLSPDFTKERIEFMHILCENDCLDDLLCKKLEAYFYKNEAQVKLMYLLLRDRKGLIPAGTLNIKLLGEKGYLLNLLMVVLLARDSYDIFKGKGISDDVFFHTMTDIRIWSENCKTRYGADGIENLQWIKHHLDCEIFRLGRLQFQFHKMSYPSYVTKEKAESVNIESGEPVLFVHIPRGEKLDTDECLRSFRLAEEFFEGRYPYKAYITVSWLLYENNKLYMKEGSNILKFEKLFDIIGTKHGDKGTLTFLFGRADIKYEDLPENSSLQKSCKAYLLSGGKIGVGYGVRMK